VITLFFSLLHCCWDCRLLYYHSLWAGQGQDSHTYTWWCKICLLVKQLFLLHISICSNRPHLCSLCIWHGLIIIIIILIITLVWCIDTCFFMLTLHRAALPDASLSVCYFHTLISLLPNYPMTCCPTTFYSYSNRLYIGTDYVCWNFALFALCFLCDWNFFIWMFCVSHISWPALQCCRILFIPEIIDCYFWFLLAVLVLQSYFRWRLSFYHTGFCWSVHLLL